jgi:electron transfer flavoprotein alpha subunit
MAGCKGAKKILAINADGEAPIMLSADYAVIGDLKEIVPAISAEIRASRATQAHAPLPDPLPEGERG